MSICATDLYINNCMSKNQTTSKLKLSDCISASAILGSQNVTHGTPRNRASVYRSIPWNAAAFLQDNGFRVSMRPYPNYACLFNHRNFEDKYVSTQDKCRTSPQKLKKVSRGARFDRATHHDERQLNIEINSCKARSK